MKIEYPKWIYHKDYAPKIVNSPEEFAASGSGWKESPAELNEVENTIVLTEKETDVEAIEIPIAYKPARRRPGRPRKIEK
jgi:hypothetical protein